MARKKGSKDTFKRNRKTKEDYYELLCKKAKERLNEQLKSNNKGS